jgi:hypothetical protein
MSFEFLCLRRVDGHRKALARPCAGCADYRAWRIGYDMSRTLRYGQR